MQNYTLWWPVVGGLAFLTVLILVIVLTGDHSPHSKDPGPPSSRVSTSIIAKAISDIEGFEHYQDLMSDAAKCFKGLIHKPCPLWMSPPPSQPRRSRLAPRRRERGARQTPPLLLRSLPHSVSSSRLRPTFINADNTSQVFSHTQQKEQTVVQMDTGEVVGQERGESSSSDEKSSRGAARSENPELQARAPVES